MENKGISGNYWPGFFLTLRWGEREEGRPGGRGETHVTEEPKASDYKMVSDS